MSGRPHHTGPPSEREAALAGPLAFKTPGTPEHAWQVIYLLKSTFRNKEVLEGNWQAALDQAEKDRIYAVVPPENPYGSLDALLQAELGVTRAESIAEMRGWAVSADADRVPTRSTAMQGNRNGARDKDSSAIGRTVSHHSRRALADRIARDRPDVLERMKRGEFKSVHQAAIAAGVRKVTVTVPLEPDAIARVLRRRLTPEQIAALVAGLTA